SARTIQHQKKPPRSASSPHPDAAYHCIARVLAERRKRGSDGFRSHTPYLPLRHAGKPQLNQTPGPKYNPKKNHPSEGRIRRSTDPVQADALSGTLPNSDEKRTARFYP